MLLVLLSVSNLPTITPTSFAKSAVDILHYVFHRHTHRPPEMLLTACMTLALLNWTPAMAKHLPYMDNYQLAGEKSSMTEQLLRNIDPNGDIRGSIARGLNHIGRGLTLVRSGVDTVKFNVDKGIQQGVQSIPNGDILIRVGNGIGDVTSGIGKIGFGAVQGVGRTVSDIHRRVKEVKTGMENAVGNVAASIGDIVDSAKTGATTVRQGLDQFTSGLQRLMADMWSARPYWKRTTKYRNVNDPWSQWNNAVTKPYPTTPSSEGLADCPYRGLGPPHGNS